MLPYHMLSYFPYCLPSECFSYPSIPQMSYFLPSYETPCERKIEPIVSMISCPAGSGSLEEVEGKSIPTGICSQKEKKTATIKVKPNLYSEKSQGRGIQAAATDCQPQFMLQHSQGLSEASAGCAVRDPCQCQAHYQTPPAADNQRGVPQMAQCGVRVQPNLCELLEDEKAVPVR